MRNPHCLSSGNGDFVFSYVSCVLSNSSRSSCYALQAVPRGPRDGEPVNKRRATRDHEAGNECPNREPQFGQYICDNKKRVKERKTSGNIWQKEEKVVTLHPVKCKGYNGHAPKGHEMMRRTSP